MKILLIQPATLADGLSVDQAFEALAKAANSPAAEFLDFAVAGNANGWRLTCMPSNIKDAFLADPGKFVIELVDENG